MAIDNRFISTGLTFTDAITNVEKLINEKQSDLELRDIYNYDCMIIKKTPAVAIVFDSATPTPKTLGYALGKERCGCSIMYVNLILYLYLESLSIGSETFSHIARLSKLTEILYCNANLYKLCTDPMVVNRTSLVGRRLATDIYLTGQTEITVPVRF